MFGLATALQLVRSHDPDELRVLRDRLIAGVLENVEGAILTGHPTLRLANNASFCFRGVAGEAVLVAMADHGVACSSGSACAAGESEPSHVLTAMGLEAEVAHMAVRFTLGLTNTEEQIDRVVELLPRIVAEVRGQPFLASLEF